MIVGSIPCFRYHPDVPDQLTNHAAIASLATLTSIISTFTLMAAMGLSMNPITMLH